MSFFRHACFFFLLHTTVCLCTLIQTRVIYVCTCLYFILIFTIDTRVKDGVQGLTRAIVSHLNFAGHICLAKITQLWSAHDLSTNRPQIFEHILTSLFIHLLTILFNEITFLNKFRIPKSRLFVNFALSCKYKII